MPWTGFAPAEVFLGQAAQRYFYKVFDKPTIKIGLEIDPKLEWRPTIYFKLNDYLIVAAEVSETTPYPKIFRISHANVLNVQLPMAMYSICTEEAFLDKGNQKEIRELEAHGYGLYTVDGDGNVQRRLDCIPLIQHIPNEEFLEEIRQLPASYRRNLKDCYEVYHKRPISGLQEITEMVEGLINISATKAVKKGWLTKVKKGAADILDDMSGNINFKPAVASIGGIRNYIKEYRNVAHHPAKTRAKAYRKYRACRHGFIDGIKQILSFRTAMKNIGIRL